MKKIFVMFLSAITIAVSAFVLAGCDYETETPPKTTTNSEYELVEVYNAYFTFGQEYYVVYNKKTKVMYYIYDGKLQEMHNADGTLMTYKEK